MFPRPMVSLLPRSSRRRPDRPRAARTSPLLGAVAAAGVSLLALPAPLAAQQPSPASEVTIEKATDGVDADAGPGPSVDAGQAVTWTWTVTSSGTTSLYDIVVTDTGGTQPDCDVTGDDQPDGTNIHPGPLDPGQSFRCTATGGADLDPGAGTYSAIGRVRASDFAASATYEDDDPSHHTPVAPFMAQPGVTIQTLVNGQAARGDDGPLIAEGSAVTWTYVVTNTGNVPLADIAVRDGSGLDVDCGGGGAIVAGPLAPGATATCTATSVAVRQSAGLQATTGSVLASAVDPVNGSPLSELGASDASAYRPVQLPGRLAFTGSSSLLIAIGLACIVAGGGLVLAVGAARQRLALARPADDERSPTSDR